MPEKSTNKCYIHFTIITVLGTILSLKLTEKTTHKQKYSPKPPVSKSLQVGCIGVKSNPIKTLRFSNMSPCHQMQMRNDYQR